MEPALTSAPPIATAAPPSSAPPSAAINHPDSIDSYPHSRNPDSWDEPPPYGPSSAAAAATANALSNTTTAPTAKLRLMCSFGGHIVPRPHDKSLCYVGGDTRIIVVDRQTSLSDLHHRLSKTLLNGKSFSLKYQLPSEDLDSLISVTTDEDLENMVDEYDRLLRSSTGSNSTAKTSRLRLFLFTSNIDSDSSSSIESLIENSSKSQQWFFNSLNWIAPAPAYKVRTFSETSSVNYLLGLDGAVNNPAGKDGEAQLETSLSMKSAGGDSAKQVDNINNNSNNEHSKNGAHDVHSVPDSPMLETTSSFGSTSSLPSIGNLPRIRVHVEEGNNQKGASGLGVEEQFQQMNVVGGVAPGANVVQKLEDDGFAVVAPVVVGAGTVITGLPVAVGGEYQNSVYSDDERSEQGIPVGFGKPSQVQIQPHQLTQLQQQQQAPKLQPSKTTGGFDLPSPDSMSSDCSVTNPLSRQKPMMYQEPAVQLHSGNGRNLPNQLDSKASDINSRMQLQQHVQESGYVLPSQFDQYQQLHQPQQFLPAGTQYIHHHPPGAVPIYYPIYPSQQLSHPHSIEHQYPVYYVPTRHTQAYNVPGQQTSFSESTPVAASSRPQTPSASPVVHPTVVYRPAPSAPAANHDLAGAVSRTLAAATPHLVQVPSGQSSPQYSGFTQNHHPSQSIAPSSVPTANYAYEFTDPAHAQTYYTQPIASQLAAQYQTMTAAPQLMLSEASAQLPTENLKQQIRMPQQ